MEIKLSLQNDMAAGRVPEAALCDLYPTHTGMEDSLIFPGKVQSNHISTFSHMSLDCGAPYLHQTRDNSPLRGSLSEGNWGPPKNPDGDVYNQQTCKAATARKGFELEFDGERHCDCMLPAGPKGERSGTQVADCSLCIANLTDSPGRSCTPFGTGDPVGCGCNGGQTGILPIINN